MYRIGEFSKMSKITIKTLRYYDEIGLLEPEKVDHFTSYRFYTTQQLVKLHHVQSFRQIGLSINEIKLIFAGQNKKNILEKRKSELKAELERITDQLSRIEFILTGKEEEIFMNYQAIIKELPECIVYYKRLTVPSYDAYFKLIPAIGKEFLKVNPDLKCVVPEYCFIVYLDGEYKEKDFNIEFCEAVDKFGNETGDIKFKKMENVMGVSIMHKGPYSELSKAYAYAFKWIEENGYIAADNPRESYIDGIWNKESEEEWLTELQIPIARK
ncbi:MerR family transcriptional regulator [Clostridium beijerinckii]|uniref:MerR family transcriptional regulator n=1 Tax=Clostridium beijerinckii TaxID=1520 RepID=UPI00098C7583|nr:MerR family transcriptional regulator [Clostridium beijerinckii]MBA8934282.1 DNA-binding transcriptional MerR regulator [Clostridium beijerinckii]NRU38474.1 DNA-binding transcriptional MerR regulator [Clostridium beijerinckii]NSA98247.1 DNA-binding transcriptional MerR regulator [Clostridium beijerinckii]